MYVYVLLINSKKTIANHLLTKKILVHVRQEVGVIRMISTVKSQPNMFIKQVLQFTMNSGYVVVACFLNS